MSRSLREVERGLRVYYADGATPGAKTGIRDVRRIGDGWENEVYAFARIDEASAEPVREDLILRVYPGEGALRKAPHEFHAMRQLHALGFPVPRVHVLELDGALFGNPFVVMEWIPGRSIAEAFAAADKARQHELLSRFCRLLVDLHALDWRSL